jgi:4-hydroxybenzoate polyprenyltransferase
LDHTLIKTDLLYESFFLLMKRKPIALFALPFWLLRGRSFLKRKVALLVQPDVRYLPFREDLVAFLQEEKRRGRTVLLVSAADQGLARSVENHLRLFDDIIASDERQNVKGANKARLLEQRFGKNGFDYVGDSRSDFAVWRSARHALVVTDSHRFTNAIKAIVPVEKVFPRHAGRVGAFVKALRIHQWSKNLLVFVPVITSHKIFDRQVLESGLLAFFSFSLFCSGIYLLNDMLDLEADRQHPTKSLRAVASGQLSIFSAVGWAGALLVSGVGLGYLSGWHFVGILALYGVANLAYSLWFKHVVMLDVVVLACFYSLRLLGGGAATGIGCSEWLIAFSVFFFFCLAMIKRYSELRGADAVEGQRGRARGYLGGDLDIIASFGVGSGLISVLVLVLYIMSPEVRLLYQRPEILLLLCPLFLYWITRIWFKARRGEVPEDPVVFALQDRTSYIAGVLAALVLYAATIRF